MNAPRPLSLEIRDYIVRLILDGRCPDGSALPSVRVLAKKLGANPLTVAKAYDRLRSDGIVEARRGIGFFVAWGGSDRLRAAERDAFLNRAWPDIRRQMARLDLDAREMLGKALR